MPKTASDDPPRPVIMQIADRSHLNWTDRCVISMDDTLCEIHKAIGTLEDCSVVFAIRVLEINDASAKSYLLSLWGLPPRVVNAITLHHEPQRDASREFTPVAAVHIANGFCNESANGIEGDQGRLNAAFLDAIGVTEYISDWRNLTQKS